MYSNELKEKITQNKGRIHTKANESLQDELNTATSWCKVNEPNYMRVYCVLNDIHEYPVCVCGINTVRYNSDKGNGFNQYCSISCTAKKAHSSKIHKDRHSTLTHEQKQSIEDKKKNTLLAKYGVDNYFKLPEFISNNYNPELVAKRDSNRIVAVTKKYGVSNVFQTSDVMNKIVQHNIDNYGVTNHTQKHMLPETLELLNSYEYMSSMAEQYSSSYIAGLLQCDSATVLKYCKKLGIVYKRKCGSTEETILNTTLSTLGVEYSKSYSGLIDGTRQEVDFYFPEHNFAVEVNGLYWHSEQVRGDKNYHQNKFLALQEKGIKLLQLWDFEVRDNLDLCVSMIKHHLRLSTTKIHARKCEVAKVHAIEASKFISENHLQQINENSVHSAYGLYYNNSLVACMSFTRVGNVYTLQRYCNLANCSVVGGFSKLLRHFTKSTAYTTLQTYSDARYSDGNVYASNGFVLEKTYTEPTYYYTNDFITLEPRWNYTRDKIQKKFPNTFNTNMTEHQNMINNGYSRVYGCCITKWVYNTSN